jgi:hypothetical protein
MDRRRNASSAGGVISETGDEGAEEGSGEDEGPGGSFGEEEEGEGREGEEDVRGGVKGCGGEGADECGEEDSYHAGIDAAEGRTKVGAGAEGAPKGEDGEHKEKAGQEDADQGGETVERGVVRGDADGGAEVGGEGEEGAGNGLGCSVTCEEGRLREPAGGDDRGLKQGKDYVASTEDEGTTAIEGGGERDEGCGAGASGEFGGDEEDGEERCCDEAGGAGDGRGWGVEGLGAFFAAEEKAGDEAGGDGDQGGKVRREEERDGGCGDRDGDAGEVRSERALHGDYGLRDDGDGD